MSSRHCPALFIAAPASGQGKTTVTAALARYHRNAGRRVQVFKTGPDFLDPMILAQAAGAPVYQLDLFMAGAAECRRRLYAAAGEADLILIEGVMGLFDGTPSGAELAETLGVPVAAVLGAAGMAQTFGALALGLASYRPSLPFAGVIANGVASARHQELITQGLPPQLPLLAALPRSAEIGLPSRHLGLLQAQEILDLEARLEAAAAAVAAAGLTALPPPVAFAPEPELESPTSLAGARIAVARDAAFGFLYPANLDLLTAMGAELRFFSPLDDQALPEADSLYLPGGYPELHLEQLVANTAMQAAIRAHNAAGKPILAECGGMLYLLEALTDKEGRRAELVGLLPGQAQLQPRLVALGLQSVELPEGGMRGHTFHHSRLESPLTPLCRGSSPSGGRAAEAVYRQGRLTASYIHLYFPSNPAATADLLRP